MSKNTWATYPQNMLRSWKLEAGMNQLEGKFKDVKETNDTSTRKTPARVPSWLEEVAKILSDAGTISRNENSRFNIKARYKMGRNAWKTTQEIERLYQEGCAFNWTDTQKPLGRVYTSTFAPSITGGIGDEFKSRDTKFKDALKFLEKDQKPQVIALCGMGGVGKTTMMLQLKKVVEGNKMFDWILKVVIGQTPDPISIQQAIADGFTHSLTETTKSTRADRLQILFQDILKKSEKGVLVILDDVWEKVELKDVGLSPLPNGVKLLLTSRFEPYCRDIAVEGNLDLKVLRVDVLEQTEAHQFLCEITGISEENDPELYQLGGEIIKKCSYLPLAIKLIAPTLIYKEKSIWNDRLRCLEKNGPHPKVQEIIKISYDYLDEEEYKEVFLLCGLFPEDSNIPLEDLTRYAWGLNLLEEVSTFGKARDRTTTCVRNLKKANLLIDGHYPGCVKMHDLVLVFVLATVSKGDHASIINHGDSSKQIGEDVSKSCKRISLTCKVMREIPEGFKFPNLSLLKLIHGDDSFMIPRGFYEYMGNLGVIAYENMRTYPVLDIACNLRTLCLHRCSFIQQFPDIENLSNLEVLSIINCGIGTLPSTIAKLEKLKVLDLTYSSCSSIDDGVLKGLVNLEELYIISYGHPRIRLTDANVDELVGCSENLTALAIEFNALPENISFKKIERFKISVGCKFEKINDQSRYTFENTLRLVTDKLELIKPKMYRLFEKTEVLYLQVDDVKDFTDLSEPPLQQQHHHHHHRSSFNSLKVLEICKCAHLKYLFTVPVANGLRRLERLTISSCYVLETVVDGNKGGDGVIKLQGLKFLSLRQLPELKSLFNAVDVIELPQLLELHLKGLPKFNNIFPLATSSVLSNISQEAVIPKFDARALTMVIIDDCGERGRNNELVVSSQKEEINVAFPSSLIHTFHHLHTLEISRHRRVEVVFEIESPSSREIATTSQNNQQPLLLPYLKDLELEDMEIMSHVWKCNWNKFLTLHKQQPEGSLSFHNLRTIYLESCNNIKYLFSPLMAKLLSNLKRIQISSCDVIEEVVSDRDDKDEEMFASTSTNKNTNLFPQLDSLYLGCLPNLKCIGGGSGAKGRSTESGTTTPICDHYKGCFSFLGCVSHPNSRGRDMRGHNMTTVQHVSPHVNDVAWSLCQYSTEIYIHECEALPHVIPSYALGQMQKLEKLDIQSCNSLVEVFETQGLNINYCGTTNMDEGSGGNDAQMVFPKVINVPQLFNLKELLIKDCNLLQYVFTFPTLKSLRQLKHLEIDNCKTMEVIVEEENGEQTMASEVVVFPRLEFIVLDNLPNLTGFFLGKNYKFQWPLLDGVWIIGCPKMKVFTACNSETPKLKHIHTKLGKHSLECGLNFPVMAATLHERPLCLDTTNACATTSEKTHWSFHNLIEIDEEYDVDAKNIIPSNEVRELRQLEKIHVMNCSLVEEVFEALEGESQSVVVEIPKLREMELMWLDNLKYIWKNSPWMVLEFPNLTKLDIICCDSLEHVFTSSMVGSLLQLQYLLIQNCKKIEVIVKGSNVVVEEGEEVEGKCDDKVNGIIKLPRLKSLILKELPSLEGFCLGKEDFSWPSLDTLEIIECGAIRLFTNRYLATPELKVIDTSFGRCELVTGQDLNSFINTKKQEGLSFGKD